MEQSSYSSQARDNEPDFNLRESCFKARISRENTSSRRFSGSYITSFREDSKSSFRSNITISSTVSSPGYPLKDEIDPSTYSFTTALKALQARSVFKSWECLSPDGFALNSKWNEAEKYICNPLSGEVPMECLSAKTLSGRYFRNLTNRITMSAPLVYSTHSRKVQPKPSAITQEYVVHQFPIPEIVEEKIEGTTRDVGTQSTPPDLNSSSPSPASTPPITERSLKRCGQEEGDSSNSSAKMKSEEEEFLNGAWNHFERIQVGAEETRENEKTVVQDPEEEEAKSNKEDEEMITGQGGCLSWIRKRQREKQKPRKKNFLLHLISINDKSTFGG